MPKLLLVPLDDTVIFPTMDLNLPRRRRAARSECCSFRATTASTRRSERSPRSPTPFACPAAARGVSLDSLHRGAIVGAAEAGVAGLRAEVEEHPDAKPVDKRTRELEREYRAVVEEILEERGADERVGAFLRSVVDPGPLADTAGYSPDLTIEQKIRILETLDVTERLELALEFQRERLTELQVRRRIRDDVESGAQKQQREYFLRQQMDSIRTRAGRGRRLGHRGLPHEDRRRRHARRRARAGRARARPPRAHGRAERRVVDDPHLPGLADRRAVEQELRRDARPRRTPARCSTPTTPAWRTSRTASPSTSPCASCARSAASRWTARRGRSSR